MYISFITILTRTAKYKTQMNKKEIKENNIKEFKNDMISRMKVKAEIVFDEMKEHKTYKQFPLSNRLERILKGHIEFINLCITINEIVITENNFNREFFRVIRNCMFSTNREYEQLLELQD